MRGLHVPCFLVLCILASGTVSAQTAGKTRLSASPSPPVTLSSKETKEIKERVAFWLKTCLSDWDQATHMTKSSWRTTCQRVATERGNFVLSPNALSMGMDGKRR
jgi:hypothetical protein